MASARTTTNSRFANGNLTEAFLRKRHDGVDLERRRVEEQATVTIRAEITALDRAGRYRIRAQGYSLDSRYPANRMAKVLLDHGYRGRLEVYGPSADGKRVILRLIGDIEKMAAKRVSETDAGFKHLGWDAKSLEA